MLTGSWADTGFGHWGLVALVLAIAVGATIWLIGRTAAHAGKSAASLDNTRALTASDPWYRALFDTSPDPMWVYDPDTLRILIVNPAAVERYGYTTAEFFGMTILDLLSRENVPAAHVSKGFFGSPADTDPDARRHRAKDGSVMDVALTSRPASFGGRPARLVVVNDLTPRRKAEAALRATNERLRRVLETSGGVHYELSLESDGAEFDWISANVSKVLGYKPSEVQGSRWWLDHVHPADAFALGGWPDPEAYHDQAIEYWFRHKDGRYRLLREKQHLMTAKPGETAKVYGTWFDITEERQLEAQFRQAQKMEVVGRLAGGIAHDFNNLLTVILGESQMVLRDPGMSGVERYESLDQITKAAERAAMLTRQLLTFSRRQLVEPTAIDLNVLVAETDKMLRRLIGENIDLQLRLHRTPVGTIADRGQIEQVIVNLVVNARDAMPDGGVLTVETAIVEFDQDHAAIHPGVARGTYAALSVTDSGVGMTDEAKAHLFEPFFTTKESGQGTGLGLATCDAIANQLGGYLIPNSEVGVGTNMTLYLPSADVVDTARGEPLASVQGGTETVLVVEDDAQVRRVVARMLGSRGYTVLEAAHANEALAIVAERGDAVNLLVTDVVLPGMGGRALADRLQELVPKLAVLFLSGYSDDVILRHRLLEHDVVLLQKPFTTDMLARKAREALR